MTETDKQFIQQNQFEIEGYKVLKLDDLRLHLSFEKFENLQIFLNGKTLCLSDKDTCIFVKDFEYFLNQN